MVKYWYSPTQARWENSQGKKHSRALVVTPEGETKEVEFTECHKENGFFGDPSYKGPIDGILVGTSEDYSHTFIDHSFFDDYWDEFKGELY